MDDKKVIEKDEERKEGLGLIVFCGYLFLIWYLIFISDILDFAKVPLYGKVLMILGTVVSSFILITTIIAIEKKIKEKAKNRFLLYILFLGSIIFNILSYFDNDLWGLKSVLVGAGFMLCMFLGVYTTTSQLFKKKLNNENKPITLIALTVFFIIIALILETVGSIKYTDILLKISVGLIYWVSISLIIYYSIFSKNNSETKEKISKILGIILIVSIVIISFPFYIKWWGLSAGDFNTFVNAYFALVGGGLTLIGVAWTIKDGDRKRQEELERREKERKEEERKKVKPFFSFAMIYREPRIDEGKICFTQEDTLYLFDVYVKITNSPLAVLNVERIYHDKKWWGVVANKTVLPGEDVCLNFKFIDGPEQLYLEVSDIMGNKYYYHMLPFYTNLISGESDIHTLRGINEIPKEQIEELI